MTALRALLRRNAGFALALMALALLLRAAMPQGWMPDAGRDALSVRLCTAHGTVEVALPGKPAAPVKQDREQPPCAFGGQAFGTPQPQLSFDLPLPPVAAEQYSAAHDRFILAQAARQMPPARAPPAKA